MMENPYHWFKINPDLFYGTDRLALISDICKRLAQGESFAIVGGRRLGKTTFLRRLEQEIKRSNSYLYPIYIDAQAVPNIATSSEAFKWIYQCTGINVDLEETNQFGRWITKAAKKTGCLKLVFLIDEFDAFCEYNWSHTFFNNWRALLHNTPGVSEFLVVVLTGTRIVQRLLEGSGSPLLNVLSCKYLALLNEEDTRQLINEPTKGRFPSEVAEMVWVKTRGHPFLIQYLMHHLCATESKTNYREVLDQAEQKFKNEYDIVFKQWWFDHLEESERNLYRILQKKGGGTVEEIVQETGRKKGEVVNGLKILSYLGLVQNFKGYYIVAGTMFDEWVVENDRETRAPDKPDKEVAASASLHELFDELENRLRYFVTERLKEIGEQQNIHKIFPEQVKKAHEIYKKNTGIAQECPPEEILMYSDFAFPFEVILRFWKQFYEAFSTPARDQILGRDLNKAKQRFEERKEFLTRIRNSLRHSRPIDEWEKDKARVFCRDLLACLSR